jgi:hypothetical protein
MPIHSPAIYNAERTFVVLNTDQNLELLEHLGAFFDVKELLCSPIKM